MSFISTFRVVALSLSLFLGLIVLGLTAHWTQVTTSAIVNRVIYDFEIVALLAGALTALALPTMLIVGQIRTGAITSMIAVELPVLTVLWILFLVNGALTAQWKDIFYPFGCGDSFNLDITQQGWCREFFAIFGASFVVWICLFLYTATLLVFALVGQSRGNTVWKSSVSEADFFTVKPSGAQLQPGGATVYLNTGAYPPAPMQQLPVTYQYASPAQPYNGLPQV